ncbi:MAG: sugar transferase [Chitinophagaceae bacterium]|jgi:lipopolysaccharide/colanic/teichoic acid biosynthesis glycosyltransferase
MLTPTFDINIEHQLKNKTFASKRIFDIFISLILLPFAIPIIFIGALVMIITSKGPALFKQQRVGLNGKSFTMFKLRTMVHSKDGYLDHTVKNDARITKAGAFLRKTKIDELPQLINVLKGDMSLIGPRPERVEIVEQFNKINDSYNLRHMVRPGITGWAQVNKPLATPNENLEKLEYDLYYINNYSVKLDVQILAKTVGVVKKLESL